MTKKKRVLMIAYHFPPVRESSGIQRTLKFCTYLREYGWEPIVLTISPKAYVTTSPDQVKEIPENVIVERAFGLDTKRHLSIAGKHFRWMAQPDRWVSWWPGAVWTGMKMIQRYSPSAIMSTFPIATAHLIGLSLCKRSGLPWVADFRDSMTEPDYPRDPMTWKVQRKLEQEVVHHCTRAVFTTEPSRQMYAERYPDIPESRWSVIENGFDEENFRDAEAQLESNALGEPGQITLVHSGVLYPQERDPRPFFAALGKLKQSGDIDRNGLQIILRATGNDDHYRPMIAALDLDDIVRLEPVVPYRDALQEMLRADGLLLFQGSVCNHQIPAKIYEYYRAGRPILALADPAGITAGMLRKADVPDIVDMADAEKIADTMVRMLDALRKGRRQGVAPAIAANNSRRSRSAELAELLNKLIT
ncbi:MAG: glycosyltransferase [Candidatus Accumulibacter sp.]|uniref:glycosyltransferase n=1 Tax=Accumulibacter sp. TaxID=2053492 RepID=UPI002587B0DD|nr:glycosyltransferase [Accumulibacter sp.]MCM8621350.1 glycosyltransferase [Accumulibacter sp.]